VTDAAVAGPLPCGPAADGVDRPYWEALREDRLVLPRCRSCSTWRELGRVLCNACWSFETDWADVAPTGSVFTWVRTHREFMPELGVPVPFVTVVVALDGAPLRLVGLLREETGAAEPVIGDRVAGVVEQPPSAAWPVLRWRRSEEGR
jgi:uncharacterized OB-fold protein